MRKTLLLALIPILCACASPQPIYKPVDVYVPVGIPCKAPEIMPPAWPLQKVDLNASLFEKVKSALVEIELRKGYEEQLSAAAKACS